MADSKYKIDLCYRAVEESDLPALRDYRNRLIGNFRQHRLLNMVNQTDWLARISRPGENGDDHIMMIAEASGGAVVDGHRILAVIGLTYIDWVQRSAEASIYVTVPGFGIGKAVLTHLCDYGFEELGLHRIYAEIFSFNAASIALFKSCGFAHEGILREAQFHKGRWYDVIVYGRLARRDK